jgi:ribosomal protein S27E
MVMFDWLTKFFAGSERRNVITSDNLAPARVAPRGAVRVWPYCRADKKTGRTIYCPECNAPEVVANFAWKEKKCHKCGTTTARNNWLTIKTKEEIAKKAVAKAKIKSKVK